MTDYDKGYINTVTLSLMNENSDRDSEFYRFTDKDGESYMYIHGDSASFPDSQCQECCESKIRIKVRIAEASVYKL